MVIFVAAPKAGEDADRFLERRFVHHDLLQTPCERPVFFDVLELFVRRRADHPERTRGEQRLHHGGEVHRAARHSSSAYGGVHLVDEQNRFRPRFECRHDGLEPLLEVAAEASASEQGTGVQREDLCTCQRALHIVVQQTRGKPFGQGCLANARIADIHRVVLPAPAEHLDGALQFA